MVKAEFQRGRGTGEEIWRYGALEGAPPEKRRRILRRGPVERGAGRKRTREEGDDSSEKEDMRRFPRPSKRVNRQPAPEDMISMFESQMFISHASKAPFSIIKSLLLQQALTNPTYHPSPQPSSPHSNALLSTQVNHALKPLTWHLWITKLDHLQTNNPKAINAWLKTTILPPSSP